MDSRKPLSCLFWISVCVALGSCGSTETATVRSTERLSGAEQPPTQPPTELAQPVFSERGPLSPTELSALELALKPHVLRGRLSPVHAIDRIANVGGTVAFVVHTDEGPELILSWPAPQPETRTAMVFLLDRTSGARVEAGEVRIEGGVTTGEVTISYDLPGSCQPAGVGRRFYRWFCSAGLEACSLVATGFEVEPERCLPGTQTPFQMDVQVLDAQHLQFVVPGAAESHIYHIAFGRSGQHVEGATSWFDFDHVEGQTADPD